MKTVFIVTQGCHEYKYIYGVFSTEEKAKDFIKMFDVTEDSDIMNIEPYNIDPICSEYKGKKAYRVRISKVGELTECKHLSTAYWLYCDDTGFDIEDNMYIYLIAKDQEDAFRIANERRIKIISEHLWGNKKHLF